jgi:hypothetical protein
VSIRSDLDVDISQCRSDTQVDLLIAPPGGRTVRYVTLILRPLALAYLCVTAADGR